jgi:hypothetical protein
MFLPASPVKNAVSGQSLLFSKNHSLSLKLKEGIRQ